MTVKEIVEKGFELSKEYSENIQPKLEKLFDVGEITFGSRYYLYNLYEDFHYGEFMKMVDKAHSKMKNGSKMSYTDALNATAKKWSWNYHLEGMQELLAKCNKLIEDNKVIA